MGIQSPQASGYTRIELCVRRGVEPIEGTCHDGSGRAAPFWGWLELIGALQTARASDPHARAEGTCSAGGIKARSAEGEHGACAIPGTEGGRAT